MLRNSTTIKDRLQHRDDFVKYFAVVPPPPGAAYLANFTIKIGPTPGYQPLVYTLANNISNMSATFQALDLRYPTPTNFSRSFSRPFFQGQD